jgi:hypothetical protein
VVACARTPFGTCEADRGRVTCWDPPLPLIWSTQGQLPTPRCLASGDSVACGYRCESAYDQVACTQTPQGTCQVADGTVACWDPALPVMMSPAP